MLACSMLTAKFFLVETHPDMQPWSTPDDLKYSTAQTPIASTSGAVANAPANLSQVSYGTFDHVSMTEAATKSPSVERKASSRASSTNSLDFRGKAFTTPVIMLVATLGM